MLLKLKKSVNKYLFINLKGIKIFGVSLIFFSAKKIFYKLVYILLLIMIINFFLDKNGYNFINKYFILFKYSNNLIIFILVSLIFVISWLSFKNEINILEKIQNKFILKIQKNFKEKNKYRKEIVLFNKIISTNTEATIIIILSAYLIFKNYYFFFFLIITFFLNLYFQIFLINKNTPLTKKIKKLLHKFENTDLSNEFKETSKIQINRLEKIILTKFMTEFFLILSIILICFIYYNFNLKTALLIEFIVIIRFLFSHLKSFFTNTYIMSEMYEKKFINNL
jgi:hypothetical protein